MSEEDRQRCLWAIVNARVKWGWTFHKKAKIMAIDTLILDAVLAALPANPLPPSGEK